MLIKCLKATNTLKFDARSCKAFNHVLSKWCSLKAFKDRLEKGPQFEHFVSNANHLKINSNSTKTQSTIENAYVASRNSIAPYIDPEVMNGNGTSVLIETYGCQMNQNDTEIAAKILRDHNYRIVADLKEASVVLLMTCAIRENAESKIWRRLRFLKERKERNKIKQIGVLGCMAERLKTKLLEKEKIVDIVAGPDSYRDLPKLLAINNLNGVNAVNVLLSFDETYSDIMPTVVCDANDEVSLMDSPVNKTQKAKKAFVSIMRGCDNMCSYCIVPFTRGRERSRDLNSILEEVKLLSKAGIKEITLLGQNVNSYRDLSQSSECSSLDDKNYSIMSSEGFKTVYRQKKGGIRFSTLLEKVAEIDEEVRIRFTSPHPKDFPTQVLNVIRTHHNICKSIHLPAQSGNNFILEQMRRGYTKEAYLELVQNMRNLMPDLSLSTDIICGYCGETEAQHEDTLDLIEKVKYNYVFVFAYSMREKTHAFHRHIDDVPQEVKIRRVQEVSEVFRRNALKLHQEMIGKQQIVLVEGESKRSQDYLMGRNDYNTKVIFPRIRVKDHRLNSYDDNIRDIKPGDYVVVNIERCTSETLSGVPLFITALADFYDNREYNVKF